jgi:hypothetical protein
MSIIAKPVNEQSDVRLAWEIAANIAPLPDILRRWTLTYDDLKKKLRDPLFRSLVKETKAIWKSELNTKERIRVKAQLLVEDSLLDVYSIVGDKAMHANARIDAFEKLAKIGDLTAPDKAQTSGERVTININLGDSTQPMKIVGEKA